MDKEMATAFVGIAFLIMVFFGTIFTGVCISNAQALECQKLNVSRSASEVLILCGKVD